MFVIYTKENCNWCVKAKELLKKHNIEYTEKILNIDFKREELYDLLSKYGEVSALTVPQIFDEQKLIGTYEDLKKYYE